MTTGERPPKCQGLPREVSGEIWPIRKSHQEPWIGVPRSCSAAGVDTGNGTKGAGWSGEASMHSHQDTRRGLGRSERQRAEAAAAATRPIHARHTTNGTPNSWAANATAKGSGRNRTPNMRHGVMGHRALRFTPARGPACAEAGERGRGGATPGMCNWAGGSGCTTHTHEAGGCGAHYRAGYNSQLIL